MGRVELVEKIVGEHPHLVRHEVEAIVDTVVAEMSDWPVRSRDPLTTEDTRATLSQVPGLDPVDAEKAALFIEMAASASEEELHQSLDALDQDMVRSVFETMFASVAHAATTMERMVSDNERIRQEFARRAVEINALQADIDARLEGLVANGSGPG